jgi:hypothetical protein
VLQANNVKEVPDLYSSGPIYLQAGTDFPFSVNSLQLPEKIMTPQKHEVIICMGAPIQDSLNNTVTCIARQRTGKHLATEYTHATIQLGMLLLVARQQSPSHSTSEVTIT